MVSEIRRIIAVAAHWRRSGQCPQRIYSLGTGETFDIRPTPDGFIDLTSGLAAHLSDDRIVLPEDKGVIDLQLAGDVAFDGYVHVSKEYFSGRAGGGASVTVYDRGQTDYFQYAVVTPTMRI